MGSLAAFTFLLQAASAGTPAEVPEARWRHIPSLYERALAYPAFALERRVGGRATLRCRINKIGAPAGCTVHSETPEGHDFGKAVMSLRSKMRFYPPKPGEDPWVLITVAFDPDPKRALHIY